MEKTKAELIDEIKELRLKCAECESAKTDRKKMEQELLKAQKLESLGVLAGGIAHDFNNYITAILNNIFLAKMHLNMEDAAFRMMAEAEKASFRAQALTQQLLTFSVGGVPIRKTISLRVVVEESAGFALRGSNLDCKYDFPDNLRPVDVDEGLMGQVIGNLVINAQHAMPDGGTIEVGAEDITVLPQDPLPLGEGEYVKLFVRDRGMGIPEEHIKKIFDPFFTTKQRGSGLGLATSFSIVKKHGGHISVESRLGKGSTFYIFLPASKNVIPVERIKEIMEFKGAGKVLVMDDEAGVRDSLGAILRSSGYEVGLAKDGDTAIKLYREALEAGEKFGLVVLDLTVPGGMGGLETIKALAAIDPDVKAVVSSGYSTDPVVSDFKEYGFIDVMAKPYRADEVFRILKNFV